MNRTVPVRTAGEIATVYGRVVAVPMSCPLAGEQLIPAHMNTSTLAMPLPPSLAFT
ncbi:MAG: hypothetical protein ACR2J8_06580 [Thermomicrobiales bacterium]